MWLNGIIFKINRHKFTVNLAALFLLSPSLLISQTYYHRSEKDYTKIDVNSISAWITDYGSFFRHPTTGNSGFEWPKGSGLYALYACGLWVGALVEGEPRVAVAEYSYEYLPGTIDAETHLPNDPADPRFKVYKIQRGITDSWDFQNWPYWDGAPLDEDGEPLSIGDQTLWTVYNDADTNAHVNMGSLPLGIEVQQTVFGDLIRPGSPFDFLIIRWLVINKSTHYLDSTYVGIWVDPDLGDSGDDQVACDTLLSLGYCYNGSDYDSEYGDHPPAVGFQILQGPLVESPVDSGIFSGWKVPETKNFNMNSFVFYAGSNENNGNPQTAQEAWYFMQARWRDGVHLTYGGTGVNPNNPKTNYMFSGDPVQGTGWLITSAFDMRFIMGSGPFSLAPGDSNEMVVAVIIARGSSNLNSITKLKGVASALQTVYPTLLYKSLRSYRKKPQPIIGLKLFQNFPNPFNSQTTISYQLPINRLVKLEIFNIRGQRVATIVDERQEPNSYSYSWDASGFASGIYFARLKVAQYQLTKKLLLIK